MEDKGEGKEGNSPKTFCIHPDTSESSLELKVLRQSTVESRCCWRSQVHTCNTHLLIRSRTLCIRYSYARIRFACVTHTLAYVLHEFLIRSHTCCMRYSYARIRFACVTHTLAYVLHALRIRLYTFCMRYSCAGIRFACVTHTRVYVLHALPIRSHTFCMRYSYARVHLHA